MNIPEHETYHALAGAVGLISLGISEAAYNQAQLFYHADENGGETALLLDDETDRLVAPLVAFGPVAAAPDVIKLARWHDPAEIRAAGNLSPRDEELIGKYRGPPDRPLIVLLGVQHLVRKLGSKFPRLVNLLAKSSNQNLDVLLAEVVPFEIALEAFEAGRIRLSTESKTVSTR